MNLFPFAAPVLTPAPLELAPLRIFLISLGSVFVTSNPINRIPGRDSALSAAKSELQAPRAPDGSAVAYAAIWRNIPTRACSSNRRIDNPLRECGCNRRIARQPHGTVRHSTTRPAPTDKIVTGGWSDLQRDRCIGIKLIYTS